MEALTVLSITHGPQLPFVTIIATVQLSLKRKSTQVLDIEPRLAKALMPFDAGTKFRSI